MESFGDRIRKLRQRAGLTQWQVADETGVSNTYISALESGRKSAPPHAIVSALASCLETSEKALWSLARSEREARLRLRIDGVPTSRRTSSASGPESSGGPLSLSEQELQQAIKTLRRASLDPRQRRRLAQELEDLGETLHKES
jgi:transcriptional regulator with XRE-family HTH domain